MLDNQLPLFSEIPLPQPGWPFAPLERGVYNFLMIDPPWRFLVRSDKGLKKSAQRHYDCLDLEHIQAFPVSDLAAPDCCLFLWATWPMLTHALETLSAWGFTYKSGGVWHKRTKHGKTAFGTGYRVRCSSEPFLLGFRGNPKNTKGSRNVIEGVVREHSRKPEEAYAWAETYLPQARRADLFSKQSRPNWESWGDQAGYFDQGEDDVVGERQSQPA